MGKISELLYMLFSFTLPEQASTKAYLVDDLFGIVMILSVVGFVGLMAVMTYFIIRYHKSNSKESAYIPHHTVLETIWTVVPTILFIGIAVWGLIAYFKMHEVPDNAYKIKVTGKQWMWEFTYDKDGKEASVGNVMYVPVNTPVLLEMTSVDVLHSFFVPSFRIKRDTVPGLRTTTTFTATKEGDFKVFCTEYCGTSHSRMRAMVRVVSQERFDRWLNFEIKENNITDPVEIGARLFAKKGCVSCHSLDGKVVVGPSLKGIWGNKRDFADGSTLTADADYIRESILKPQSKIVKGFSNVRMNSFAGQLDEKDIDHVIEYLKTIK